MKTVKIKITALLAPVCAAMFLCTACAPRPVPYTTSGFALDTLVSITVYDTDKAHAQSVLNDAMGLCTYYDDLFGISSSSGDIYRLNHADGEALQVSDETYDILQKSLEYSAVSDGLFDVTVQPLYDLWDFGKEHTQLPDEEAIMRARSCVDYHGIHLHEDHTVSLDTDTQINLGAIAKGYIADRIREKMITENISSALINLGGNIQTIGSKPDGSPFMIGLQKPFDDTGAVLDEVDVTGRSVVTSGIYQRYFQYDGRIYHHILDPFTGYPADHDLNAAVIVADSSTDADAYSTICMLLGYRKACDFISSKSNVEAYLIDRDNVIHHVP